MDRAIVTEYRRLRAKGWAARQALSAARTLARFNDANADGELVRVRAEYDSEPYDHGDCASERDIAETNALIASWGLYGLIAEYRVTEDDEWEQVDAVWGFIGNDLADNGYDDDLRESAVNALAKAQAAAETARLALLADAACELAARPTYAGVAS